MKNQSIYNRNITFKAIIVFTIPTIIMMLIQQSYSMIDGIFISNIIGDTALSSITLISPYLNFFVAISAMFASGGSAVVMKKMGEKNEKEAREDFTFLILLNIIIGILLTIFILIFTKPLVSIFNANEIATDYCFKYLFTYAFFIVPNLLFSNLQIYTIASGNTKRAMFSAILGGIFNIIFDYILIKLFNLKMIGAAIATGLGMLITCLLLGYPMFKRNNLLHFTIPKFRRSTLFKSISNGFSEFASNLVSGIVMLLFNHQMLRISGVDGVAASTITFYVFSLMSAMYMGYMFGISPLLSYFYGEKNSKNLKKLKCISLRLIGLVAIITTAFSIIFSKVLVGIFTSPNTISYNLAINGNKLFSFALLFVGFNTFSSMLFTALSNGKISAIIAFSRTFIFLVGTIIILPILFNINGLWLSVPVSEFLALILSIYYLKKYKKTYQY